jgi:hypothetical protein
MLLQQTILLQTTQAIGKQCARNPGQSAFQVIKSISASQ